MYWSVGYLDQAFNPGFWMYIFLVAFAFFPVIIALFYIFWPLFNYQTDCEKLIIKPICDFVGDLTYTAHVDKPIDVKMYAKLGLVPGWYRQTTGAKFEDQFVGHVEGKQFRWMEGRIERHKSKVGVQGDGKTTIVFSGCFLTIEVLTPFQNPVRVAQKKSTSWAAYDVDVDILSKPVEIDDDDFSSIFEIHAFDQGEAVKLLTPYFRSFLLNLAKRYEDGRLTAAFAEGEFHLAIETEEDVMVHFDGGKPMNEIQDIVAGLLRDIHAVHALAASVP